MLGSISTAFRRNSAIAAGYAEDRDPPQGVSAAAASALSPASCTPRMAAVLVSRPCERASTAAPAQVAQCRATASTRARVSVGSSAPPTRRRDSKAARAEAWTMASVVAAAAKLPRAAVSPYATAAATAGLGSPASAACDQNLSFWCKIQRR